MTSWRQVSQSRTAQRRTGRRNLQLPPWHPSSESWRSAPSRLLPPLTIPQPLNLPLQAALTIMSPPQRHLPRQLHLPHLAPTPRFFSPQIPHPSPAARVFPIHPSHPSPAARVIELHLSQSPPAALTGPSPSRIRRLRAGHPAESFRDQGMISQTGCPPWRKGWTRLRTGLPVLILG
jgi:hypothetical protein